VDLDGWAEEEVPPPTDADAPPQYDDPANEVEPWELTRAEKRIYEAGFTTAYLMRTNEIKRLTQAVDRLNNEADRLYRIAFDHRHCSCWKGHHHDPTTSPL
jgi:hypothetical protein